MIEFNLPNFRVRVSEKKINEMGEEVTSKKRRWRYCYAENQNQALALITAQDKNVYVHENTIKAWNFNQEWEEEVEHIITEITNAVANNQNPKFPNNWSKLKEHLLDVFHGKCGYCEARFTPTSFGDVEHYRPKGRVSEEPGHRGYYWLAYEPTNYLPACQLCNEPAKRDHFPIAGTRARSAEDPLDAENPLLINPYRDHYEEHLEFLPSTYPPQPGTTPLLPGGVKGKTQKGNFTISTMELYRDPIRQERLREMGVARLNIKDAYRKLGETEEWDEFAQSLQMHLSEDRPFRTAVYYEFRDYLIRVKYWDEDTIKQVFTALGLHTG